MFSLRLTSSDPRKSETRRDWQELLVKRGFLWRLNFRRCPLGSLGRHSIVERKLFPSFFCPYLLQSQMVKCAQLSSHPMLPENPKFSGFLWKHRPTKSNTQIQMNNCMNLHGLPSTSSIHQPCHTARSPWVRLSHPSFMDLETETQGQPTNEGWVVLHS